MCSSTPAKLLRSKALWWATQRRLVTGPPRRYVSHAAGASEPGRSSSRPPAPVIEWPLARTRAAEMMLARIFKASYRYTKAGVMLEDLVDQTHVQGGQTPG